MESTNNSEIDANSALSQYHRTILENSLYHCFKCNKPFTQANRASSYMDKERHLCITCFPEEQHFTPDLNQMRQADSSKTRINDTIDLFYSVLGSSLSQTHPISTFTQLSSDYSTACSSKQSIQDIPLEEDNITLYTQEHAYILHFLKLAKLELFYYLGVNGDLTIYNKEGFLSILGVKHVSCVQGELAYLDEQNCIYFLDKENESFEKMLSTNSDFISAIFAGEKYVFVLKKNVLSREIKGKRKGRKAVSDVLDVLDFSGDHLLVYKTDNSVVLLGEDLSEIIAYSNTACLKTGCITSNGFVLLDTSGLCQIFRVGEEKPELLISHFSNIVFIQGVIVGICETSIYSTDLSTLEPVKMYGSNSLECSLFKLNTALIAVFSREEEVLVTADTVENIQLIPSSTLVSDLGGY